MVKELIIHIHPVHGYKCTTKVFCWRLVVKGSRYHLFSSDSETCTFDDLYLFHTKKEGLNKVKKLELTVIA